MYLFVDFLTPLEVQHIQFKEVWELRRIKVYMCRSLLKTLLSYLFAFFLLLLFLSLLSLDFMRLQSSCLYFR